MMADGERGGRPLGDLKHGRVPMSSQNGVEGGGDKQDESVGGFS